MRTNPEARALPGSSPSEEVVENQQNHRAGSRYEEAVEVESAYARGSKHAEQPATGKSAYNTQQDVEQYALASPIDNLAADESGNQTENDPGQKRHGLFRLARDRTHRRGRPAVSADSP